MKQSNTIKNVHAVFELQRLKNILIQIVDNVLGNILPNATIVL